jgi:hypothetical protein
MDEFKEELIKRYVHFVYEGGELVKFWNDIEFDFNRGDKMLIFWDDKGFNNILYEKIYNEKLEILVKHCLKHNVLEFVKTSYILNSCSSYCELIRKFDLGYENKPKGYNSREYLMDKISIILNQYIEPDINENNNISSCCISYNDYINIFKDMLRIFDIDYKNIDIY